MKTDKKRRVAWGITGGGDRIAETLEIMRRVKEQYRSTVDIQVFVSKAGVQVLKYYRLWDALRAHFERVFVEVDANSPFLAGMLQMGKFEFLLIAPATSNTVAKIVAGITDSMLANAAIMGLKAFKSVYVMPTDYKEGEYFTKLPSGEEMKLRVRKEDAENTRKLASIDGVTVLKKPADIERVFKKRFGC